MIETVMRALGMALAMGWEVLWPLILGFTMIGAEADEVMTVVQRAMLADLPYPRLRDAVIVHPTDGGGRRPALLKDADPMRFP